VNGVQVKWKCRVIRIYRSSGSAGSSGDIDLWIIRQLEVQVQVEVQDRGLTGANGSSGSQRKCRIIRINRFEGNNAGTRYNFSNSTVDADPNNRFIITHQ
jgi:hypothetical protein